jgi:Bacterial PH domain
VAAEDPDFLLGTSALQPGEHALTYQRPSGRLVVAEVLQTIAVVGGTLLIQWLVYEILHRLTGYSDPEVAAEGFGYSALGIEAVFLLPRVFRAWIHVAFTEYVLTDQRIYARTEFISTDLRVMPYERVTLLVIRRSFVEWLLGISSLQVRAYGHLREQVRLRGLKDPRPLFRAARDGLVRHHTANAIIRSD